MRRKTQQNNTKNPNKIIKLHILWCILWTYCTKEKVQAYNKLGSKRRYSEDAAKLHLSF